MSFPGGEDAWKWLKTAPLPVVMALTLALSGWVWSVDRAVYAQAQATAADKTVQQERDKDRDERNKRIEEKLDKLLQDVADVKAKAEAEQATKDRERREEKKK